jgi:polyhydroxybutyrate depolymerase
MDCETKYIQMQEVQREYLLCIPLQAPAGIVLVFHGNGGTAQGFSNKFHLQKAFPDFVVAYIQGIPGIGGGFDPKGLKNGWQRKLGEGEDRDLRLMDVLVPELLREWPFLKDRVFAFGHSNGGRFVYLLWNQRPDLFRGFIVNAHQGTDLLNTVQPKNAMVLTGTKDRVVNNVNQMKSAEMIRTRLETDHEKKVNDQLTIYSNRSTGLCLYHYIHPGGHDLPKTSIPFIGKFLSAAVADIPND